jgi:hypothetical protein
MGAEAMGGSLRRHGRLLGSLPSVLAATKQVLFSYPLVPSPSYSMAPPLFSLLSFYFFPSQ